MRVLITGGAGFVGTNVGEYFIAHDWDVVAYDNLVRVGVEENVKYMQNFYKDKYQLVRGDIRCTEDFQRLPKKIDAIINLAANPGIPWSITNPIYDLHSNLNGAVNVLEYARKIGACVIQASTNKVYSDAVNDLPVMEEEKRYRLLPPYENGIPETFPMDGQGRPRSPYGCSKSAADLYTQEYNVIFNVPTVVCRMSAIFGKRQLGVEDQGWVTWFMYAKKHKKPLVIYGSGKQVRDLLYAEDLARLYYILVRDIDIHRGQVLNVGGGPGSTISVLEMIDWLNEKDGPKLKPTFEDWRLADHKVYISDTSKVNEFWQPEFTMKQGLECTWEWLNSIDYEWVN